MNGADCFGVPGVRCFQVGIYVLDDLLLKLLASISGEEDRGSV